MTIDVDGSHSRFATIEGNVSGNCRLRIESRIKLQHSPTNLGAVHGPVEGVFSFFSAWLAVSEGDRFSRGHGARMIVGAE